MRDQYDFSKGVRGKYTDRLAAGTKLVVLDPDVAKAFPTSDRPLRATYREGKVLVVLESGLEIAFPIAGNRRLEGKPEASLERIELSPFGLHWPDLDEDLSIRGILAGDFGQRHRAA